LEYSLLGGLTLVCAFACFYLSIRPSAFFADFLLSGGLVLKGTWVLQVGLSLYSDEFAFKGCGKVVDVRGEGSADVKCVLDEDRLRGVALTNLLFVGHSIVVLILCFVITGLLNRNKARTGVAFLVHYLMNVKGVVGLGELEYSLLRRLPLVCAFTCFYLSIWPSAFFAVSGIVMKGTRILQVGLSFYSDAYAFKGCGKVVIASGQGNADAKCDLLVCWAFNYAVNIVFSEYGITKS
nr:APC membrane recruitment protein like [Tanacetum cinerariifolium]